MSIVLEGPFASALPAGCSMFMLSFSGCNECLDNLCIQEDFTKALSVQNESKRSMEHTLEPSLF